MQIKRDHLTTERIITKLITKWENSEHTAEYLLEEAFSESNSDRKTRSNITEEFLTWARSRGSARYLLNHKLKKGIDSLPPDLRRYLEVAVTRLLVDERTPKPIIVSKAVDTIKSEFGLGLARVANAVLRNLAENGPEWPLQADTIEYLANSTSHPAWLIECWLQLWDKSQVEALLEWDNQRPSTWLRRNHLRGTPAEALKELKEKGVEFDVDVNFPDYFRLKSSFYPNAAHLVSEGWFSVQDPSASLAVRLLNPQPGMVIADLCAAPGGKTTLMAQLTGNQADINAVDPSADRMNRLNEAINRLGISCITLHVADAKVYASKTKKRYDAVLLDVPCSGLGVLSRRADLRWRRKPQDIAELSRLQIDLLDSAAEIVKKEGSLIYSTCTIDPEENEHVIDSFLRSHSEFHLVAPELTGLDHFKTQTDYLKTFSPRDKIDGIFAAKLVKLS